MTDSHLRPGWQALLPYLIVDDAAKLLDWLARALGAEVEDVDKHDDGSVMHASVRLGGGVLEVSDARPEFPARPCALHYYVPDVDKLFQAAVALGTEVLMPPVDHDYGERACGLQDPCGNHWYLATYTG